MKWRSLDSEGFCRYAMTKDPVETSKMHTSHQPEQK